MRRTLPSPPSADMKPVSTSRRLSEDTPPLLGASIIQCVLKSGFWCVGFHMILIIITEFLCRWLISSPVRNDKMEWYHRWWTMLRTLLLHMHNSPNTWCRHQMEPFSALLAICAGNSLVTGEFPAQRPVTRIFDVFFDLRLNKRLSKQWWGWWLETSSRPLWRHYNAICCEDVVHHFDAWAK